MINKAITKTLFALAALIALPAQAVVVYDVSSTSVVNCSGAAHGLWTNGDIGGGSCSNFFDIQDGSTFTLFNDSGDSSDWTGQLVATAMNPQGVVADINLTFSNFAETHDDYKQEGGIAYDPFTDTPDIDFFLSVAGSIDINGTNYNIDSFVENFGFQYGLGANAKTSFEYGASAWIQSPDIRSHHWDLNLVFTPVPEPTTLALFGIGIIGVSLASRKRKA